MTYEKGSQKMYLFSFRCSNAIKRKIVPLWYASSASAPHANNILKETKRKKIRKSHYYCCYTYKVHVETSHLTNKRDDKISKRVHPYPRITNLLISTGNQLHMDLLVVVHSQRRTF